MSEKKIATPEIARATWEEMHNPSVRRIEAKLKAAGYVTPSYRTINKWQKEAEQAGMPWVTKHAAPAAGKGKIRKARQALDDASPAITGDPRTNAEDVVEAVMKQLPPPDTEQPKAEQNDDAEAQRQADEQAARERLKAIRDIISGEVTDEQLLTLAARQTLKTAIVIEAVLGEMAPALIAAAPEAVGKLQLAVAESLAAAGEPYDRVGRARELSMKTIGGGGPANGALNGEIIAPGVADPLAEALAAYKRHAA
jgi:hypothetical protein